MTRVVLDIETLAFPIDQFDPVQREYLFKFARTDEERNDVLHRMNLFPTTARILAIGMLNPDSARGRILLSADRLARTTTDDGSFHLVAGTERDILEQFWHDILPFDQIITFNGRCFDHPFILFRSAVQGMAATRDLMPYRYSAVPHCDLLDQLTWYGATRKFNLDFYCKSFGITSPKGGGVTGLDMGRLVEQGAWADIAEYCGGDLRATAELFRRWQNLYRRNDHNGRPHTTWTGGTVIRGNGSGDRL